MAIPIKTGDVFRVRYPFIRKVHESWDFDGPTQIESWVPGVASRMLPPDDAEAYANGEGWQILTVVSVHKPGRFPTRVFFTQQFEDPDGGTFGKNGCRVLTQQAFRHRIAGYGENVGGIFYVVDPDEREGA